MMIAETILYFQINLNDPDRQSYQSPLKADSQDSLSLSRSSLTGTTCQLE